jgi:Raf kinase inhibitor-like YbhB/YbcL family protein
MRRPRSALALSVLLLTLAACAHNDGRTLAVPTTVEGSQATVPSTFPLDGSGSASDGPGTGSGPVGTQDDGQGSTPASFALESPAMAPDQMASDRYSCRPGPGVSPPLAWTGVPPDTVELVLVSTDLDTPQPFVHWVVSGILPALPGFPEGAVPEGPIQSLNGAGQPGWQPFCPPPGQTHRYQFTLYALTRPSGITASTAAADAVATLGQSSAPVTNFNVLFGTPAQ